MEQAFSVIHKKLTEFVNVEDAPLTAESIQSGNATNDNDVFIDAQKLTEPGSDGLLSNSEKQLIRSVQSQIHALTKTNALTQLTSDIHTYLTENVQSVATKYSRQVTNEIETLREKKEQLQTAWASRATQNAALVEPPAANTNATGAADEFEQTLKKEAAAEDRHVSELATESFSSILLLLLQSVETHQPSVIDQVLILALQLYENLPVNYLAKRSAHKQFLFQPLITLTNYINQLPIVDDAVRKQNITRVRLSLAMAKGSFGDLLPLLDQLLFDTNGVLDVRKLLTQLNNQIILETRKSENTHLQMIMAVFSEDAREPAEGLTAVEIPAASVAYLTSVGAFPNTEVAKLGDQQLSGPSIASVILMHLDFHHDLNANQQFALGSMNESIVFTFEPSTFKHLLNILERLTSKPVLPIDSSMLTVLLKLSNSHLRYLCAMREEVPVAKPNPALDSTTFITDDDLRKWFDLLLKLSLASDTGVAQKSIAEEAFKALQYIIHLRSPTFADKLAFYHQSLPENTVLILAKQSLAELNKGAALLRWIDLLCQDNDSAFQVLFSFIDTLFDTSKATEAVQIEPILQNIQRLLLSKLLSADRTTNTTATDTDSPLPAGSVMSKLIAYILPRGFSGGDLGKNFFYSIILDVCMLTNVKDPLHFVTIQSIFTHILPLLSDCVFHDSMEEEKRTTFCWLLGQIVNLLIVGSPRDSLEEKYLDKLESPLFAGGCEETVIEKQQSLRNLLRSNLAVAYPTAQKETKVTSAVDDDFLSSVYNRVDPGAQLLTRMKLFGKNKRAQLQKSVEQQADQACAAVFAVYIKYFARIDLAKHECVRPTSQKPHLKLQAIFDYASYVYVLFATTKGQGGDCQQLLNQIQTNALFLLTTIARSPLVPDTELETTEAQQGSARKSSRWKKERHSFRLIRNVVKASSRFRKTLLATKRSLAEKQDHERRLQQSIDEFIYRTSDYQSVRSDELVSCMVRQYERAATRLMAYRFIAAISDKALAAQDPQRLRVFLTVCFPYFRGAHVEWTYLERIPTVNETLKEEIADCYYSIVKRTLSLPAQSAISTRTVFHLLNFIYAQSDILRLNENSFVDVFFNTYVSLVQEPNSSVSLHTKFLGYSWFRFYLLNLSRQLDAESPQAQFVFHRLLLAELKRCQQSKPTGDNVEVKSDSLMNSACAWFVQAASAGIADAKPDTALHVNQLLLLLLRCLDACPNARVCCATASYANVLLSIYRQSKNHLSILLSLKVLRYLFPMLSECADDSFRALIKTLLEEILLAIGQSSSAVTTELVYLYRMVMSAASPWQIIAVQMLLDTITAKFQSLEQLSDDQVQRLFSALAILGGYIYPYSLTTIVQVYSEDDIMLESQFAVIVNIDQAALESDSPDARPYVMQYHHSNKIESVGAHKIRAEVEVSPPANLDENMSALFDALVSFIHSEVNEKSSLLVWELKRRSMAALYRLLNNQKAIDSFLTKPYASNLIKLSTSDFLTKSTYQPQGLRLSNKQHLEQYSLSLDRCERSLQVIDDPSVDPKSSSAFVRWNEQPIEQDHLTAELLASALTPDYRWKPTVSKKEMQALKRGRIGNDTIEIVPTPLTVTKTWFPEESGIHHRHLGRVYLISESSDTSMITFTVENLRLSEGKWYFCVRLLEGSQTQIGWSTTGFTPSDTVGIGNDHYSWSYDGSQNILYHGEQHPFLTGDVRWGVSDVCGCGIDIDGDQIRISYWLNGHSLGTAFAHQAPVGTSTAVCNMLPNGYGATYSPGVTLRAANYAMSSCEFIFHPGDMSDCPLPTGYKPLLLPALASIDRVLVAYPAQAYAIGNDAHEYRQRRRDVKDKTFLRDFVGDAHLEQHQLTWSTDSDGFPLTIDHQGSLTIGFDFELLAKVEQAEVVLLSLAKSDALSIRIPTDKIVSTNRVAITVDVATRKISVYLNKDSRTFDLVSVPAYQLRLLPHLPAGLKNLGVWKYALPEEQIRRLFTYGLTYVRLDDQRLRVHRQRAAAWTFEKKQTCFADRLLVALNQPFDEQRYRQVQDHIAHDESKYFQPIEGTERSAVQMLGNQTYLVAGKSDGIWSEYTLVLDVAIATLPKAGERITLVTIGETPSTVFIDERARICVSTGVQSELALKPNQYTRVVIVVNQTSLRIFANGSMAIDTTAGENDWAIKETYLPLFLEVDLTKNSTDEHAVRIACQSIAYCKQASTTIDGKLHSTIYSLDTFVAPPYETIAPSLLLIGYEQPAIELVSKRNPTATLQTMDTLLREKKKTTEDILLKLQHTIPVSHAEPQQSLDSLGEVIFNHRNTPPTTSTATTDAVELDKKWFAHAAHRLNINESLMDWVRDKSKHADEVEATYQLLDFNQPQQEVTAPLYYQHKLVHYSHKQLTRSQHRQSRIACEQELIGIYAHYTILNMLKIWSADTSNPFPLEAFGDYTFIITLLKLLDYHYTYTRLHIDENVDRMSLLTSAVVKMEIHELIKHRTSGEKQLSDAIFAQHAPLLHQLQKDIVQQWVRYLADPSEKIFDDDVEANKTISKHAVLSQPNFQFLLKLFQLFLKLVADRVVDDVDFLIDLLFPPLYINLLFDLFLLSQSTQSKVLISHVFSTLLQTSRRFALDKSIQSFLFQLFLELSPNPASIKSRAMKTFQMCLMDIAYLLIERWDEQPIVKVNLSELAPNFHELLATVNLIHVLTDKSKAVKARILGQEPWKLTAEAIESASGHFDPTTDQQLMRFLNSHPLAEPGLVQLIESLPTDLAPNPSHYRIYPSLAHIPAIHIQTRVKLIHQLNLSLDNVLQTVDLNLLPGQSLLVDTIRLARCHILHPIKFHFLHTSLNATESASPGGVPTVNFDIVAAGSNQKTEACTMFVQAYEQLHRDAHQTFRVPNERLWLAQYIGMHSTDQGGPYRDSVTRMCADLCSTRLSLFILCPNARMNNGWNRDRWIPNVFPPNRSIPHRVKKQYRFVGQLMGMAVRKKHYLDLKLPELLWKQLVREPITLEDIESIDVQSFTMIKEMEKTIEQVQSMGNIDELITSMMDDLHFEGVSSAGQTYELVPGGKQVPITAHNFKDYCHAYREYRLNEFRRQIEFIRQGLYNIVPGRYLSLFTANELEQAVCGKGEIDVALLQRNTSYGGDFTEAHAVIQRFWKVLTEMFNEEQRKLFLIFVWGRCTLPSRDEDFVNHFSISPYDEPGHEVDGALPCSHTCSFAIDLPRYSSADIMYERLNYAITYCSTIDGDGMLNNLPAPTEFDSDLSASEQ